MSLARRSGRRFEANIWPGFVDAMTSLLLVLMFVLTIFMIVQFILRETITGQETELDELTSQVSSLADALGLEKSRSAELEGNVERLTATLATARSESEAQATTIARLTEDLAAGEAARTALEGRIEDFEAQLARLIIARNTALAERDTARGERDVALSERNAARNERDTSLSERNAARDERDTALSERDTTRGERDAALAERDTALAERDSARDQAAGLAEQRSALETALAAARSELDASAEAARLAAARREAFEALIADLRRRASESDAAARQAETALAEAQAAREASDAALSEEEKARLAEAEAARLLRERLLGAQTEITAMTLALEEERRRAEETLTLLAAARSAEKDLQGKLDTQASALTDAERDAALRATAEAQLAQEKEISAEAQRRVTLLNEQIAALRAQLGELQGMLDASAEKDRQADVQIEALGSQLNAALAQVADEQRRRAALEEAERKRLEEEARRLAEEAKGLQASAAELERYRSEFFGRLRDILAGREGVRVVGDRFVFSSEVLFQTGSADLAPEGRAQIASVASLLLDVAREIPQGIDWILRVDGHTDNVPISGGRYADNWELSQARALSVVRFMINQLDFPADRLAATGFGEFQPVAEGDSAEARAQNRRIELKLTER